MLFLFFIILIIILIFHIKKINLNNLNNLNNSNNRNLEMVVKVNNIHPNEQCFCSYKDDGLYSHSKGNNKMKLYYNYLNYTQLKNTPAKNPIVLCMATGYHWNKLRYFVVTLRRSKYKDDLVLMLLKWQVVEFRNETIQYNIKVLLLNDKYPYWSSENKEFHLDDEQIEICMGPLKFLKKRDWIVTRVYVVSCFIKHFGKDYSHLLTCDVKDIIFQRNPFNWNIGNAVYFTEEYDDSYVVENENFHKIWIMNYEYAYQLYCCRLINAGLIIGSVSELSKFFDKYNSYLTNEKQIKTDQGHLTAMIYAEKDNNFKIILAKHLKSYGLMLGIACCQNDSLKVKKDGLIHNIDGTIPAIIHQYDRCKRFKLWGKYKAFR